MAANGEEASAALDRELRPVLMDVQMPEMDGLRGHRSDSRARSGTGRHVPIVAMTAHAMKGDRERCLAAGMDDYISKPIQTKPSVRVLDTLMAAEAVS